MKIQLQWGKKTTQKQQQNTFEGLCCTEGEETGLGLCLRGRRHLRDASPCAAAGKATRPPLLGGSALMQPPEERLGPSETCGPGEICLNRAWGYAGARA